MQYIYYNDMYVISDKSQHIGRQFSYS